MKISLIVLILSFYFNNAICQHNGFIENNGQIVDQNGVPRENVFYSIHNSNMNIFFTDKGFEVNFIHQIDENKYEINRVEFNFPFEFQKENVKSEKVISELKFILDKKNFKTANEYERITFSSNDNKYSVRFYIAENNQLKYDIIIDKSVRNKNFPIGIKGAYKNLTVNNEYWGFSTLCSGEYKEKVPKVYQEESGKKVKFNIEKTDSGIIFNFLENDFINESLVIDPELHYASYYGGSMVDRVVSINKDNNKNIIFSGISTSNQYIATSGSFVDTLINGTGFFVTKFDVNFNRLWSTYFADGSSGDPRGIVTDENRNIYISGNITTDNSFFNSFAVEQSSFGGGFQDAFICKFDENGWPVWANYLGGNGTDISYFIDIQNDNMLIGGVTSSVNNITTPGAYDVIHKGGNDGFFAIYDTSGIKTYSTYYSGSTSNDGVYDGMLDEQGNIYLIGNTRNYALGTSGPYQNPSTTIGSVPFVAKFSNNNQKIWHSYFSGTSFTSSSNLNITQDLSGDLVFGFSTSSTPSNLISVNAEQTTNNGALDIFLANIDSTGQSLNWGRLFGGSQNEYLSSLDVDEKNNIVLLGNTVSFDLASVGSHKEQYTYSNPTTPEKKDGMIQFFENNGNWIKGSYYGGVLNDEIYDGCYFQRGSVLFCGETNSSSQIATYNAFQPTFFSSHSFTRSGFFGLFQDERDSLSIISPLGDSTLCSADSVSIFFDIQGYLNDNHTLLLYVSDNQGNFSSQWHSQINAYSSDSIQLDFSGEPSGLYNFFISDFSGNLLSDTGSFYLEKSPEVTFYFQSNLQNISFYSYTNNTNQFNWDFGDGNSSSDANPNHTYSANGIYTVVLEGVNDLCATTWEDTINLQFLDIENLSNDITVYPNPIENTVYYNYDGKVDRIVISSIEGKRINEIYNPIHNYIDFSFLSSGVYVVSFTINTQIKTFKICKK